MITFKPIIADIKEYQRGTLPQNARKIDTANSIDEMMKKSAPITAMLCVSLIATMFIKTFMSHTRVIYPIGILIGLMIGFILLLVHEWLHAIVYPRQAKVTIGRVKGKILFVALASYPMSRIRFILMSLLPFLLGILPLVVFIISPAENKMLNGVMFGMASIGMTSPALDVYNVVAVLRFSKRGEKIMFYEDDLFRFS